jgi:hypothetical protein
LLAFFDNTRCRWQGWLSLSCQGATYNSFNTNPNHENSDLKR